MDWQTGFMILLGITTGILGWFSRTLWDAVVQLKDEINKLEVRMSSEYVRYDRLQDAFKPIMEALSEIKLTLRNKVDK